MKISLMVYLQSLHMTVETKYSRFMVSPPHPPQQEKFAGCPWPVFQVTIVEPPDATIP